MKSNRELYLKFNNARYKIFENLYKVITYKKYRAMK